MVYVLRSNAALRAQMAKVKYVIRKIQRLKIIIRMIILQSLRKRFETVSSQSYHKLQIRGLLPVPLKFSPILYSSPGVFLFLAASVPPSQCTGKAPDVLFMQALVLPRPGAIRCTLTRSTNKTL